MDHVEGGPESAGPHERTPQRGLVERGPAEVGPGSGAVTPGAVGRCHGSQPAPRRALLANARTRPDRADGGSRAPGVRRQPCPAGSLVSPGMPLFTPYASAHACGKHRTDEAERRRYATEQ
ncbi:hypothetical protein SFR_4734 [Streptomyces sp. FR-008]|nr:hypothetical protein SFR_4734 [Streptomyces sp. FR-008]